MKKISKRTRCKPARGLTAKDYPGCPPSCNTNFYPIYHLSFIRVCNYVVVTMLHNLAVLSASSLLDYLQNQIAKPIVIEDVVQVITINEDGEEEYEPISQMPSQTSRISQVCSTAMFLVITYCATV